MSQAIDLAAQPYRAPLAERLAIRWDRLRRWEFWPAWLFYIPIVGYILWLGLRFRQPTAFTASNPAFESGGVVGESKTVALAALMDRAPDLVAHFERLDVETPLATRIDRALAFVAGGYPVVLKPDIGARGRGVAVIRDEAALIAYLRSATGDVLVQRYIGGDEFGIFIYRQPRDGTAVIYSITQKCFPSVAGDGEHSLVELIARDTRARLIAPLLWRRFATRLHEIPARGETFPLVEIGAHCRGSLFLDASSLATPELTDAIARVFAAIPGFHFGRLDLRCPSAAALSAGHELRILEVNGVTAEAAHIYHPGTPLLAGYRSMFRQWRIAFEIGAANAAQGAAITGPFELLSRFRADLRRGRDWH
ncbi:hypothetical protein G7Y85_11795 [Solimonas terrae]|uniref:ATP-grasp domain-containing protein n=1 Tax=Solimonas terrae TaxID=1396819 RepID=A0A6M2BSW5_9GAMM|nr:hypothetical protein [Solimonas terrae]